MEAVNVGRCKRGGKGWAGVLGLALATALAHPARAATPEELRAQMQALRVEQARIAELAGELEAKLQALEARAGSGTAVPATTARATTPAVIENHTGSGSSRLSVSGDVRLRSQGDYADNARDRDSAQIRGRLGATLRVTDAVTIGARLVTGDADDPNSSDVQLSNFADDLQFTLDQAYVRWRVGDLDLYGGKIPQPFTRTELVWDGDVSPQGLSAVYKSVGNGSALRLNGLFFVVDEDAIGADSTMLGAQIGYDFGVGPDLGFDVSAAYYDYTLGSIIGADAGDFRSNLRNPDGSYRSDFNLGDLIVGATWTGAGERWPVRAVADYVHNFGAATSQDTGYGIDLSLGRASHPGDWRVTYGYSVAETDAVLAAFSHDNIALATNYQLHAVTLDYVPMPKTLLTAIWYHYRPHAGTSAADADGWLERIRLAFLVSF